MRRRSVEEVPELSDSEGEELQPRRPVPPTQDGPRQPLGSAPVPGRRGAGRGGMVAPPAPATQPSIRQPTGVPIRRGSSGVSNVPLPAPPAAQSRDGSIRQPTGVPIRQRRGSSGGSSSPALPPRGTDNPTSLGRRAGVDSQTMPPRETLDSSVSPAHRAAEHLAAPVVQTARMRAGVPRRTGSPFVLEADDQTEISAAEPALPAQSGLSADDVAESSSQRALRQRRLRQEGRETLAPAGDDANGEVHSDTMDSSGNRETQQRRKAGERKNAVADAGVDSHAAMVALAESKATEREPTFRSIPGFDSPPVSQDLPIGNTADPAMPGALMIEVPEPAPQSKEQQPDIRAGTTPLSAVVERRRRRRTSAAEVVEIGLDEIGPEANDKDKWKERVSKFYQDSTGGTAEEKQMKALDFVAKAAVRQRTLAQEKLEAALAQAEVDEAERRRKRREAGLDEDGKSSGEEEVDELSYGTLGSKLRPVGVDADKDWGDTAAIWNEHKMEYPRHPGREVCVRYAKTGRCKFCDEGLKCNFDHPPPPKDVEQQRKFLRKKGLRIMRATWGNFTRKGKPVPGKSIDVTNALNAMIVEQGGVQLELPKDGKAHLPGFGDPCPGMKKQLRMEIVLSGGGKRTTKKKYKENQHVLIYTRRTRACLYTKLCLAFSCPILGLLVACLFAARWMWGNLYQGCVDADFSECSVNDGTYPVVTQIPCIIPYNFSSENVELINVEMERGDVNITVAPTPENLIIIEIQHIAKSNAAIIGMSSSAVLEDGILNVANTWNESHTEDAEVGPIHTLNCFRGIINITLPPDMAYLRPKLNVTITGKPNVCSIWNPSGCNEEFFLGMTGWEWSKMALALEEPFIEPYGNIFVNSQQWYGLEAMADGVGFLWTSLHLSTNAGQIETHNVELSDEVGPEAAIVCTVDAPPDYELGHPGHPELGSKGDVLVHDSFAHQVQVLTAGGGMVDVNNLQLFATEGQFAQLGQLQLNVTGNGAVALQRVRNGDIDANTEGGDVRILLGPLYFEGAYSLDSASAATVSIRDVNFTMEHSGSSISGMIGNQGGKQKVGAMSTEGHVELQVADSIDADELRPRPVDGIKYPCQVNPNGPGCHGPDVGDACTSCGR
eukprot:COSAG02_NODE_2077_length_9916_cov_9.422489_5_plen_1119_part_00